MSKTKVKKSNWKWVLCGAVLILACLVSVIFYKVLMPTKSIVNNSEEAADYISKIQEVAKDGISVDPDDIVVQPLDLGVEQLSFYRYSPSISGVLVEGNQIVLWVDEDGTVGGMTNSYVDGLKNIDMIPEFSEEEAKDKVVDYIRSNYDAKADIQDTLLADNFKLVIAQRDTGEWKLCYKTFFDPEDGNFQIADGYFYVVANGQDAGSTTYIESTNVGFASTETITEVITDSYGGRRGITVEKKGKTVRLRDDDRNITVYRKTLIFPKTKVSEKDVESDKAKEVLANVEYIYDYFYNTLGYRSYDGNGAEIQILWDPNGKDFPCWNPEKYWIEVPCGGNYYKCFDAMGHEYTHAVMQSIAGGVFSNGKEPDESRALGEAYGDIIGNIIENDYYNSYSIPIDENTKYLIGNNGEIPRRNMSTPSACNNKELGWYYASNYSEINKGTEWENWKKLNAEEKDYRGGHAFSTIFSHAVYSMMTDQEISEITDPEWARIFYYSIYGLTPQATFSDARGAIEYIVEKMGLGKKIKEEIGEKFEAAGIVFSKINKYYEIIGKIRQTVQKDIPGLSPSEYWTIDDISDDLVNTMHERALSIFKDNLDKKVSEVNSIQLIGLEMLSLKEGSSPNMDGYVEENNVVYLWYQANVTSKESRITGTVYKYARFRNLALTGDGEVANLDDVLEDIKVPWASGRSTYWGFGTEWDAGSEYTQLPDDLGVAYAGYDNLYDMKTNCNNNYQANYIQTGRAYYKLWENPDLKNDIAENSVSSKEKKWYRVSGPGKLEDVLIDEPIRESVFIEQVGLDNQDAFWCDGEAIYEVDQNAHMLLRRNLETGETEVLCSLAEEFSVGSTDFSENNVSIGYCFENKIFITQFCQYSHVSTYIYDRETGEHSLFMDDVAVIAGIDNLLFCKVGNGGSNQRLKKIEDGVAVDCDDLGMSSCDVASIDGRLYYSSCDDPNQSYLDIMCLEPDGSKKHLGRVESEVDMFINVSDYKRDGCTVFDANGHEYFYTYEQ